MPHTDTQDTAKPKKKKTMSGWITPLVQFAVTVGSWPSGVVIGHRRYLQKVTPTPEETRKSALRIDTFIGLCVAAEIASYLAVAFWRSEWPGLAVVFLVIVSWRVIDIVCTAVRITLFDPLLVPPGGKAYVASHERIIVLGLLNYFELILCFGTIYAFDVSNIGSLASKKDWFDPLYLSAVSLLTIGYGNLYPSGWLRVMACLQGLFGLAVLLFIVTRFITVLKPQHSLEEETRLGGAERDVDAREPTVLQKDSTSSSAAGPIEKGG